MKVNIPEQGGLVRVFTRAVYELWDFRTGRKKVVFGPRYELGPGGEIRSPRTRFIKTEYQLH